MSTTSKDDNQRLMTEEEIYALLDAANEADDRGDEEEALRITKLIPLKPILAWTLATQAGYGPERLKRSGLNLSEAEAKYGPNWLDKL